MSAQHQTNSPMRRYRSARQRHHWLSNPLNWLNWRGVCHPHTACRWEICTAPALLGAGL
jgi:hypothetical protein